jgi:isopentenyldiphosphate isomerase
MTELYPLYDEQGEQIKGSDADPQEVLTKGLLHGASHVWVWRQLENSAEVLVQKRASAKTTWPNLYDISAAGHIDSGETPIIAAIREAKEEINLDIDSTQLKLISVMRIQLATETGLIENEFQWLYLLKLSSDITFTLQESEVESLEWVTLDTFKSESVNGMYVPHGNLYYSTVVQAIQSQL